MFDTPEKRAEALRFAVAEAGVRLRTSILTLVSVSLYIAVTVLATTDSDLLLGRIYHLPIADVELPVTWFYVVAPLVYVVLHLALLTQLVQALHRLATFAQAVSETPQFQQVPARERLLLLALNAPLALLREPGDASARRLGNLKGTSRLLAIIPMAVVPLAVLALIHFRFLAYQSAAITGLQLGLMAIDALFIVVTLQRMRSSLDTALRASGAIAPAASPHPRRPWIAIQLLSLAAVGCYALFTTFDTHWMPAWRRIDLNRQAAGATAAPSRAITFDAALLAARLSLVREIGTRTIGLDEIALIHRDVVTLPAPIALQGRTLRRARLVGAQLARADFSGADLSEADLQHSDLRGALLEDAMLDGADLSYARLELADLTDASLRAAVAPYTKFEGALLHNTDFTGAKLEGAHLQFLRYDDAGPTTKEPKGALQPPILAGADLFKAQMQGTDFTNLDLRAADLRCAQLHGAKIELAVRRDADFTDALRSSGDAPWVVHRSSRAGEMIGSRCPARMDFSSIYYDAAMIAGEATWEWILQAVRVLQQLERSCAAHQAPPGSRSLLSAGAPLARGDRLTAASDDYCSQPRRRGGVASLHRP